MDSEAASAGTAKIAAAEAAKGTEPKTQEAGSPHLQPQKDADGTLPPAPNSETPKTTQARLIEIAQVADANPREQQGVPNSEQELQLIDTQLGQSIHNSEIATIASRYLRDNEKTDIQTLLRNKDTRPLVIDQLGKISDRAYRSLVSSLVEGPEEINAIGGVQASVDVLSREMMTRGSAIFERGKFNLPNDPDYWVDETRFIDTRKTSGDSRWLVWDVNNPEHRAAAESILAEARGLEDGLGTFLDQIRQRAGLAEGAFVNISHRTKGVESLLNKTGKFRETEWGKDATIADAVDLLGGRIVVQDLTSLEKIMTTLESTAEGTPGVQILRKENKFIANHEKPDPYRAIQYIVTIPGEGGKLHTFELQLKTFSSMVASDLFHNAVYKPDVLNLPAELQQVVREYNWESDEREMMDYLDVKTGVTAELTPDQQIEKAISELDYNAFYDLVLSKVDPGKPLDEAARQRLQLFHQKEVAKFQGLQDRDESAVLELAGAAHDSYYQKAAKDLVENPKSDQLGNSIPEAALQYLSPEAQAKYKARYETFNGRNNKLSVEDLQLYKLTDEQLTQFLTAAGKDLSTDGTKVSALVEKVKQFRGEDEVSKAERQKMNVMNLYHAPFEQLVRLTQESSPDAIQDPQVRELWKQTLISSQIKAIATSSILTEVGGYDSVGNLRDLSREVIQGSGYSQREMLTFLFFTSADRSSSEFANTSYQEFATSEQTAWARDFDRTMDRAILTKLTAIQLQSIDQAMAGEPSAVYMARYQKARYELMNKYIRSMVANPYLADRVSPSITQRSREEVGLLLEGSEESLELAAKIKDPAAFQEFSTFITTEAGVPNIVLQRS
ncbi:hypothetical protein A3C59_04400 [Candidatus Daviesbacteria bacterium RIFCSPHIGHO2_02_FULL_36_13]|uniref:RelA/SpoT domain-containing protein n=1 Tax=Candidatus Daviesbacteria bacterium RIFCSPHIGHO2_02_FULL_36_13 TaxID=1797768 RepID=A0A1F5JW20_9BACT|nr:MAG: hypothetical protein A3C59_04400 [Candidatus Daviesbacteria bacterium RIFCSPHIGHO2_02_FULL_36_13]